MPRYIIERSFRDGVAIADGIEGASACRELVGINDLVGVSWIHSYIRDDRGAMFCVYDAPNPEAIRRAAERNGLPVDRISRVTVLDPYAYAFGDRPSPARRPRYAARPPLGGRD